MSSKIGDLVKIRYNNIVFDGKVTGFAREETLPFWITQGRPVEVELLADSFIEGKVELKVPTKAIRAIKLQEQVEIQGKVIGEAGTVKIVTRTAMSEFEKKIHHRFPVVKINNRPYIFKKHDIIPRRNHEQRTSQT